MPVANAVLEAYLLGYASQSFNAADEINYIKESIPIVLSDKNINLL